MSQSPGKPPSKEEVERIIKEVDIDGDGSINFNGESVPHSTCDDGIEATEEDRRRYVDAYSISSR